VGGERGGIHLGGAVEQRVDGRVQPHIGSQDRLGGGEPDPPRVQRGSDRRPDRQFPQPAGDLGDAHGVGTRHPAFGGEGLHQVAVTSRCGHPPRRQRQRGADQPGVHPTLQRAQGGEVAEQPLLVERAERIDPHGQRRRSARTSSATVGAEGGVSEGAGGVRHAGTLPAHHHENERTYES
jgi:hypothetical protein